MMDATFAKGYFEKNRDAVLKSYYELVRIPTVGAQPIHLGDCARAAAWLKQFLKPLGFEVELITPPTEPPVPVVFAERKATPRPGHSPKTVLFYGHYDVQPPDPLELWETPPFEPTLKEDGRVYARGAQDDKGQFFSFLCGLKALVESGAELPNFKLLLEGEEENGSMGLFSLLPELTPRLHADVLLVCDTAAAPNGQPAIVAGLRGVQHYTIELKGADYDLHSGAHGGIAPNPAQGIAELVASLHNPDGSIAVEGFNDCVCPPTEREIEEAKRGEITDEEYEKTTGVPPVGGERALLPVDRKCFRATIEVNGIHSGYGGAGSKTIIPARAFAKISARLVPDQSPQHVFDAVKAHVEKHCPAGMTVEITDVHLGASGFRLPLDSPIFWIAKEELEKLDSKGPVFIWEGASIPIVSELRHRSGGAPLLVGFGSERDKIHSPNESFSLDQFVRSMTWATLILQALAE